MYLPIKTNKKLCFARQNKTDCKKKNEGKIENEKREIMNE